jgi:hypothetical protein
MRLPFALGISSRQLRLLAVIAGLHGFLCLLPTSLMAQANQAQDLFKMELPSVELQGSSKAPNSSDRAQGPSKQESTSKEGTLNAIKNSQVALQLIQEAFKCKTSVSKNGNKRSFSELEYKGDTKKFLLSVTISSILSTGELVQEFSWYTSFIALLSVDHDGKQFTVTCNKTACLAHSWTSGGCSDTGACGNISNKSIKKEYVDSLRTELCDADAAKDAVDGLNALARTGTH